VKILWSDSSRGNPLKILITGHTGFKGSWLTLLLEHLGHQVSGFALSPVNGSLYKRVERWHHDSYIGDIREHNLITEIVQRVQPQVVFHFAAQALVLDSIAKPVETFQTNVLGTANLLEACRVTSTVKTVIVSTTDKVYLNQEKGLRFSEMDSLGGKDPYSASKVGQEQVINAWRYLSQIENGPQILTARAGNVIGGGDFARNRLIPDIIRNSQAHRPVPIRNPNSTRPWQHVLDPLIGYCMYVDHSLKVPATSVLNFGPRENSETVLNVLQEFRRNWPEEIKVELVDPGIVLEANSLELDSARAWEELGWRPTLTQLEAVAMTAAWWKRILFEQSSVRETSLSDIQSLLARLRSSKRPMLKTEHLHDQG
jgi:CDP-glucose 4,6-dehydratase